MKVLADEALAAPSGRSALQELKRTFKEGQYWDRYYALVFLGRIAEQRGGSMREEIVPTLIVALKDTEGTIRRVAASAIREIGSEAADKAIPELLAIVERGEEDDVTWFAAAALGKVTDKQSLPRVVAILGLALKRPGVMQDGGPQLREYALASMESIGRIERTLVLAELERALPGIGDSFADKVKMLIGRLRNGAKSE
jgi:HEAT repeat protein